MKNKFTFYFLCLLVITTFDLKGQSFCLSDPVKKGNEAKFNTLTIGPQATATSEVCKLYWINVYIHRINGNGFGYGSSVDNTILSNLNSSYNQYGFYFQLSGSRDWNNNFFADPNTPAFALQSIFDHVDASQHTNAIDIYVLPSNSQIQGGFVPGNNKKVMAIGGTRSVSHCSGGSTTYQIALQRIVSHEMGHCFGLVHTFQNSGDDGLSDTPIDYVTNNGCVNPNTCQFVNNCGYPNCNVTSNPTSSMTNFMSYTVPTCMSAFSPMQIDLMRSSLNTSLTSVVSSSQTGAPNMQLMTYDSNQPVSTVNFVFSGWHNIYTNIDPATLISNLSWSANTSYLYPSGTKLVNAGVVVNSGQSITVSITGSNICGTSNRNPTFVAYYGYSISPNPLTGNSLSVKFDGSERNELLPQFISILDENSGQSEINIDVQNEKLLGRINQNILNINVAELKSGIKLVKVLYKNPNSNDTGFVFKNIERVIINK